MTCPLSCLVLVVKAMPLVRFASLALIVLALALIPNVAHASNVLDLTGETFDDALKANPNGILVEFFAPCAPSYDPYDFFVDSFIRVRSLPEARSRV